MKNYYKPIIACLFALVSMTSLNAQNGANILIDHGPCDPIVIILCPSGVSNPSRAVDDDLTTYATLKTNIGILSSSFLEMGFTNPAPGGSMVAVYVGDDIILNVDVLESVNLYLMDENGNVIAQKTGLALAEVQLLNDGRGIAKIKVPKNTTAYSLKITLGGLVSINNQMDVYGAVHAPAAEIVYADYIFAQGPCDPIVPLVCGSGVLNAENSIDLNKNNYALLTIPLDIAASAYLDLGFTNPGMGGSTVSFTCGTNGGPLGVALLSNLKITVYNSAGQVVKNKNGFTLAEVELIGSDKFKVKVRIPAGASDVARARITLKSLVGLITEVRVYNAAYTPYIDFASYFKEGVTSAGLQDQLMEVYPNPANNVLYIQVEDLISDHSVLSVYSSDGKLLHEQMSSGTDVETIDVSDLNNGIYFITLSGNEIIKNSVFIINR